MNTGNNPANELGREIRRVTDQLLKECLEQSRRMIESVISAHARSDKAFPTKLDWISGVWIGGARGQVLTADGKPVLWVGVGPRTVKAMGSDKIAFLSFTSIDLSQFEDSPKAAPAPIPPVLGAP